MKRSSNLPVMVGQKLRKGLIATKSQKGTGYNLWIVWLKRGYESRAAFDIEDVEKINTVIHFCDKESIKITIEQLRWILEQWEDENNDQQRLDKDMAP